MKSLIAVLTFTLALALTPAPRIRIQNPQLLYAVAMYKTAVGDTGAALRLVHRAEQARQSRAVQPAAVQSARDHSTVRAIL